jgi:hypothetical protein
VFAVQLDGPVLKTISDVLGKQKVYVLNELAQNLLNGLTHFGKPLYQTDYFVTIIPEDRRGCDLRLIIVLRVHGMERSICISYVSYNLFVSLFFVHSWSLSNCIIFRTCQL